MEKMDKDYINKITLKKLQKRKDYLSDAIKLDKPKIFKLSKSTDKKTTGKKSKSKTNYRQNTYSYIEYPQQNLIKGLYIFEPFYQNNYLANFYDMLELTFHSHRNDSSFVYNYDNKIVQLFSNFNLYQLIEYSYILNPTLGKYLFRYLVDIMYLLKVPKDRLTDFYRRSSLFIVRYERGAPVHSPFDKIASSTGIIVTMSLGPNVNYYNITSNSADLRVFYKNGSVVVLEGESKYLWSQITTDNLINVTDYYRYVIVLLTYPILEGNCTYVDTYGNPVCYYYNQYFK